MFYEEAVGLDQTKEEKRAWMKANAKVGTTIVILDTQAGLNRYQKTNIERITNRHIYTDKTGYYGGRVWHYSGINTFAKPHCLFPPLTFWKLPKSSSHTKL
jgi:hypothetical protein